MIRRSTAGSSARLTNSAAFSSAPVLSKSCTKKLYSSAVIPIAQKTTTKSSSLPTSLACLAICKAMSLWGRPDAEKIGSFCPRTRLVQASIAEIPVWMNCSGLSRL